MMTEKTDKRGSGALARRENNLNVVRLLGAVFVFAGHMGPISGGSAPLFGCYSLHELGVFILFLLSGYLISMSWLSDSHPLRYGIRRFFRFWPAFAVLVLLMVFVTGPLLSNLGIRGYFQNVYHLYLRNLRFFPVYMQPGVFTDVPFANTTNGSLWTMPVEAGLYVVTPLILSAFRVKRRSRGSLYGMAILAGGSILFDVYLRTRCAGASIVIYGVELIGAFHVICFYLIGMLFTYEEVRRCLNIQVACVSMFLLLLVQHSGVGIQYLLLLLILPYVIFSFGFAPDPVFKRFGNRLELSYGIYLYGFFFQQLVVSWEVHQGISLGYLSTFLLSFLPTVLAAALSYCLVEKPALRLSRFLIKKLRSEKAGSV